MKELFYYKSPIGILEISTDFNELTSLKPVEEYLQIKDSAFSKEIKKQLDEYFSGSRKTFNIKINPTGTNFQKTVWKELIKIPYSTTKSYGEIAIDIEKSGAQRAVGNACNKNPIMIIIPCHRVVGKNEELTGFAYGLPIKKYLLELEKSND